jgi:D-3-phosphoglycerate dehydrogenase
VRKREAIVTKVAVTNRFLTMLPEVMAELKELYPDVKVNTEIPKMNEDQLIEFLQGIDVVLAGLDPYTDKVLSKLPDLKVIACCSAGVDHIDPLLMQKYQVRMGWVPGVNKHSVSELALSFMINLLRQVNLQNVAMRNGEWPPRAFGLQLRGRTVGIHGCGHIGQELVKLLQPFDVNILASDRLDYADFYKEYGVRAVEPEELWAESEILSVHLSRNSTTIGMYSAEVLDKLRPGIFLIQTSRGRMFDEVALQERLQDGRIAAAAFDVFAMEPVDSLDLVELPNFLATPHIGGSAREAWVAMSRAGMQGITENAIPEPGVYPFD